MVYLYKKNVGGKEYYYLRMSKQVEGKSITKDIAYLGDDIANVQDKLDNLPKKYASDIRKAYRNIHKFISSEYLLKKVKEKKLKKVAFLSRFELEKIEAIRLHHKENFLKHDKKTIEDVYNGYLVDFAHNSTSLEGNTITLKEAAKLLLEELSPANKELREIYDLQNTKKVFFDFLEEKSELNHELIISIHDKLMKDIDVRVGYRTTNIRVFKSKFECSPGKYVRTDMDILLKWYEEKKNKLHPVVLAAIFHHKFEQIHPFSDGNGRTGRLIMNFILLNCGCPPFVVKKKNRLEYLNALSKADGSGILETDEKKYRPVVEFIASEFISSYWNIFLI